MMQAAAAQHNIVLTSCIVVLPSFPYRAVSSAYSCENTPDDRIANGRRRVGLLPPGEQKEQRPAVGSCAPTDRYQPG